MITKLYARNASLAVLCSRSSGLFGAQGHLSQNWARIWEIDIEMILFLRRKDRVGL